MSATALILFAGISLTLVTIVLAFGNASSGPRGKLRKRAAGLAAGRTQGPSPRGGTATTANLRRTEGRSWAMVEQIAKRFLPRQSALRDRLERTGKNIAMGTYALISLGVGVIVFGVVWLVAGLPPVLAALIGFVAGIGLPHMAIGILGARRKKKFLTILPDAIDLIVRGLKSGLPVTESIAAVGREMADPVGTEFRHISDSVRFGQQLEEAVWETAKRLDTPEFNFFVISMSIQRETGGNLGEALGNLSEILRGRQQMQLKIRAMSSEARASAYILGSLPFIMFAIVYVISPGYASQLFTDPRGMIMVGAGVVSMTIGIAIMIKMVRFEV